MNVVHYSAGMDSDGRVMMVPVSADQFNAQPLAPVPVAPSRPAIAPVAAQPEPKPEAVRGIPISLILIGGLLCFLVLNPSHSGPTVSELEAENRYLNQKVSELQHQLIGVYSGQ